jgi:hypothetical protein
MISEFDCFIGGAMTEAAGIFGTSTIKANGRTAPCVANVPDKSKSLMDSGLLEKLARIITLSRADFTRLAIADRLRVTVDGTAFKVMTIEDDGRAPIVSVNLEIYRA